MKCKVVQKHCDSRSALDKIKRILVPIRQSIIADPVYLVYTSKSDELL